jgi:hypothetical protein
MQGCFTWILLLIGGIFLLMTILRWFEQTAEAVDNGWWNKTLVLIGMPFAVWLFPGRVAAGRPTPVPRHQPVRGFGGAPKTLPPSSDIAAGPEIPLAKLAAPAPEGPPPGTPPEFIGKPVIRPRKKPSSVDPEKIARLRRKMREQGMLPGENDEQ